MFEKDYSIQSRYAKILLAMIKTKKGFENWTFYTVDVKYVNRFIYNISH